MKKGIKLLAVFFITVIFASGFAITASAEFVSQSTVKSSSVICVPDDYAKIQWAVDNASAGNTIIVRAGTYVENVEVDKSLTIRSENGSAHTIVHAANLTEPLFEVTANYVHISGFTVDATERWMPWSPAIGIYLNNANHCDVSTNSISNSQDGIKLLKSSNNTIVNNYLHNSDNGVLLEFSSNNSISNNSMFGINHGIHLKKSSNNNITDNNILLCYWFGYGKAGIHLEKSSNNKIVNNNLSSNYWPGSWCYGSEEIGIYLSSSSNNKITNNSFKNDGIFISGTEVHHYNSHIIENNDANGKPIYYYKNTKGIRVPEDAGEIIFANCSNMTVENVNVSSSSVGVEIAYTDKALISNITASKKNYYGLYLYNSSNIIVSNSEANGNFNGIYIEKSRYIKIINSDISHNSLRGEGICLKSSSNNKITNNNVCLNNGTGIYLDFSSHNEIYLNNFINNSNNVYSSNSSNIWDSTSKITYTYNENAYTNYLGNYWNDCHRVDANEDGIGDIPYVINSDKDNYPLVTHWENYISEVKEVSGFEVIVVIVGLSVVAYLIKRRK